MAKTDFLPEDYLEKRNQRRTNIVSLSLFVVVMTGIIGAFLVTDRQRSEVTRRQAEVNAEFEEAAKRLEQLEDLHVRKDEMLRKARVTSALIERVPRSFILAELINLMPSTLSLLELELTSKVKRVAVVATTSMQQAKQRNLKAARGARSPDPAPEVPQDEVTLRLVGVAPTDVQVAQYMTSLSRSEMFSDVNLAFSEEVKLIDDYLMRKFRIDLQLDSTAAAIELEPKLVQRDLKQNPMSNTIQIDANGNLVIPTDPAQVVVPVGDTREAK